MMLKRVVTMAAVLLILAGSFAGNNPVAANEQENEATVQVLLWDMGLESGAFGDWEAALFSGTAAGDDNEGRFTAWTPANNGEVTFSLPEDVLAGQEAPWNEPDNLYVRVRLANQADFPVFDLVSERLTLENQDYRVLFTLYSAVVSQEEGNGSTITVHLMDRGGTFGAIEDWQAALYTGTAPGQETAGRFTNWAAAANGMAEIAIPADLVPETAAPWGEEVYIRIQSMEGDYPEFDATGMPFILLEGESYTAHLVVYRGVVDVLLHVTLQDFGPEFGAVQDWEVALFAGIEPGQEHQGRLTEWVRGGGEHAIIALPAHLLVEDTEGLYGQDVYLRLRTLEGEYPILSLTGAPFELVENDQHLLFSLQAHNAVTEGEETITLRLMDTPAPFGAVQSWEAALYTGTLPGQEEQGRFTAWKTVSGEGEVVFTLPEDVLEEQDTPWGQPVYLRVRTTGDGTTTFDVVLPFFTLVEGSSVETTLTLTRGVIPVEPVGVEIFLPLLLQGTVLSPES
jgi:hypothetical protein